MHRYGPRVFFLGNSDFLPDFTRDEHSQVNPRSASERHQHQERCVAKKEPYLGDFKEFASLLDGLCDNDAEGHAPHRGDPIQNPMEELLTPSHGLAKRGVDGD